jgi:hypothetical protein
MTTGWGITLATLLTFISNASWSNEIYVRQVGDNTDMTITQDGANNKITGSGGKAQVSGNNTSTAYAQTGDNNQAWVWMSSVNGINNLSQTGDNNSASLDCHGNSCVIDIEQNGNYNLANGELGNGGDNDQTIVIDQDGDYNSAKIEANGDDNTITVDQDGNTHEADIMVSGDDNDVLLTQTGSSKYAFLDMLGSPHDFDISQTGSGNHSVSIDIETGSNAMADINSTQYGSNSMTYSVVGTCFLDTGCALNIDQNGN